MCRGATEPPCKSQKSARPAGRGQATDTKCPTLGL